MNLALIDSELYEDQGLIEIIEVYSKHTQGYKYYREESQVVTEDIRGWDDYTCIRKGESFDEGRFYFLSED